MLKHFDDILEEIIIEILIKTKEELHVDIFEEDQIYFIF